MPRPWRWVLAFAIAAAGVSGCARQSRFVARPESLPPTNRIPVELAVMRVAPAPVAAPSRAAEAPPKCGYFRARAKDLADIPTFLVGLSSRDAVDVGVTKFAHFGLGGSGNKMVGIGYGAAGVASERTKGFPWTNSKAVADWKAAFCFFAHDLKVDHTRVAYAAYPLAPPGDRAVYEDKGRAVIWVGERGQALPAVRWADLEAEGSCAPVALRLGFSPGELADFVAGWFGADLAGDDARPFGRRLYDPPAPRPAARAVAETKAVDSPSRTL